jgi:hypothetical protein
VTNWKAVWEKRTLDPAASVLSALMAADGLDTGMAAMAQRAMALLDVTDKAREEAASQARRASMGPDRGPARAGLRERALSVQRVRMAVID